MLFFVHGTSGELYGRAVAPLWGPFDRWWGTPTYCRVSPELCLTPLQVRGCTGLLRAVCPLLMLVPLGFSGACCV